MQLINIGFGNIVSANRIISIVSPESAPIKRLIQEAKDSKMAVDASCGRRTRAVIIMDSGHVILSAVQPETVASRLDKDVSKEYIEEWYCREEWKLTSSDDTGDIALLTGNCIRISSVPIHYIKRRLIKMIIKPTVTDLLEIFDNRFELVIVTSKRARQISSGDKTFTKVDEKSAVTLAANEIAEGKVVKC